MAGVAREGEFRVVMSARSRRIAACSERFAAGDRRIRISDGVTSTERATTRGAGLVRTATTVLRNARDSVAAVECHRGDRPQKYGARRHRHLSASRTTAHATNPPGRTAARGASGLQHVAIGAPGARTAPCGPHGCIPHLGASPHGTTSKPVSQHRDECLSNTRPLSRRPEVVAMVQAWHVRRHHR